MEWMILPYKHYADFSGRSRRMEYWMFRLFEVGVFVAFFVLLFLLAAASGSTGDETGGGIFELIGALMILVFALGSFIPGLAVTVRRLHDTNRSGWTILVSLIPLIGVIMLLVFLFGSGTHGPNQYGSDPKEDRPPNEVFA